MEQVVSKVAALALTSLPAFAKNGAPMPVMSTGAFTLDCDIAILNGPVMDLKTRLDAVRKTGVKDSRNAVIKEDDNTGKNTIDTSDHVVTAGFTNTDTHNYDN